MKCILGIDTSNYTTSAALCDVETGKIVSALKRLLPVKKGELGLRQSDAVFHHTVALPDIISQLYENTECETAAVCVSEKPCEEKGSYMPCFLAGVSAAQTAANALGAPLFKTTHQIGHIMACLYAADKLCLSEREFICFHVSGGTTQALLVSPSENVVTAKTVSESSDLKAGQAIDRIGAALGFAFPAGAELDALAQKSLRTFKRRAVMNGSEFSLSGLQNLAQKMISDGETPADTARFTVDYIANTLEESVEYLQEKYGEMPLCFAGGVMSNKIIRERFEKKFGAYFCAPEFSSDNAAGIAVLGRILYGEIGGERKSAQQLY